MEKFSTQIEFFSQHQNFHASEAFATELALILRNSCHPSTI